MRFVLTPLIALAPALLAACFDTHGSLPVTPDLGAPPADRDAGDRETGTLDAGAAGEIRIGAFNVRRFFDLTCDTGTCSADSFEALPEPADFDGRAAQIAVAIAAMEVDVVALAEIESAACLEALELALSDKFSVFVLGETGGPGSLDTAVLARGTHLATLTHREQPLPLPDGGTTTFARELLEVHVAIDGRRVVLFAAHFKAKSDDDPARRLAEATAAHDLVRATATAYPDALVVLGGDLNDTPGSPPLEALEGSGALARVGTDLPAGEQWTTTFAGQGQWLDHLLHATEAAGAYVAGSAAIHRGQTGGGYAGSDHAAISATFTR